MSPKKSDEKIEKEVSTKKDLKKKASATKTPTEKKPMKIVSKKTTSVSTSSKKTTPLSKGKQKKLRIDDKYTGTQYYLGVGKRKSSIALVRLHEKGKGEVFVNNKNFKDYFFGILLENAVHPLLLAGKRKDFNITIKVTGGGVASQSDAVRHGIARALVIFNPELRAVLKKSGLLTRDARVKERKKPGLKRARRAPQWKKR